MPELAVLDFSRQNPVRFGFFHATGLTRFDDRGSSIPCPLPPSEDSHPVCRRRHEILANYRDSIRSDTEVLGAVDFFTAEGWTAGGLMTYYVPVFMRIAPRRICLAGTTLATDGEWMKQTGRNMTMAGTVDLQQAPPLTQHGSVDQDHNLGNVYGARYSLVSSAFADWASPEFSASVP